MKKILLTLILLLVPATSFSGMQEGPDKVTIPLNEVSDGMAHYYSLEVDGVDVRFFVVKSKDGVIRAAFDACDVCYRSRKGYSQKGDFMICNNCGMKFHSTRINVVNGGCNPSPLERQTEGDKLIITKAALKMGKQYF